MKEKQEASLLLAAGKSYHAVDEVTYLRMINEAKSPRRLENTLREDYEFCLHDDKILLVSYGCSCNVCGFSFSFEQEYDIINGDSTYINLPKICLGKIE